MDKSRGTGRVMNTEGRVKYQPCRTYCSPGSAGGQGFKVAREIAASTGILFGVTARTNKDKVIPIIPHA